jgi:hypothetical protein
VRRSFAYIATVAALVLAGVAYAALGGHGHHHGHDGHDGHDGHWSYHRTQKLRVAGHARGLYPGRTAHVRLEVRNGFPFAVEVSSIRARARNAAPHCPGYTVVIRPHRPLRTALPAHRRRRLHMRIRMRRSARDACQGARFPLRFRVRATR